MMKKSKLQDVSGLIFFILLCGVVELLGGWFTSLSVKDWYPTLIKPSWTPPAWLFGPVWTSLYLLMAISAWLVWRKNPPSQVLWLFGLQLFLNLIWSALFFGLRSPLLGLMDISALWIAIAATMLVFTKVDFKAGLLLLPYWLWTTYALALNGCIWYLNRR